MTLGEFKKLILDQVYGNRGPWTARRVGNG
jgi:hypothetical protein